MPDDATERLRRNRVVEVPAFLVMDPGDVPDELRRFCANPVVIPVRIRPRTED